MCETSKDQEKGDEVLRRLLKTPPDPKTGRGKETGGEPHVGGKPFKAASAATPTHLRDSQTKQPRR